MAKTNARTGVGELSALLPSWRLHLAAANLSPRSIRAYTDDGKLFLTFLAAQGMPTGGISLPVVAPESTSQRSDASFQACGSGAPHGTGGWLRSVPIPVGELEA